MTCCSWSSHCSLHFPVKASSSLHGTNCTHKVKQLPINICLTLDELTICENLSSATAVTAVALAKAEFVANTACMATKTCPMTAASIQLSCLVHAMQCITDSGCHSQPLGPALETVQHTWQGHSKDHCHGLLYSHPPRL